MDRQAEGDEFERMRLLAGNEQARMLIEQYEHHQGIYRKCVEDNLYALGMLDERLGS